MDGADRHKDWLRAGQALQHVLLTATSYGIRTSMPHQAMEWKDLRAAVNGSQQRCPRLLIRFGYEPEGSRTPRAAAYAASPATPGKAASGGRAARPVGRVRSAAQTGQACGNARGFRLSRRCAYLRSRVP